MAHRSRIIRLEGTVPQGVRHFLSGLHVQLEEGKTTSWVTIARTGQFTDPRYGKFDITRPMLLSMVYNFDRRTYGQDIFIDVAHKPSDGAAGKVLKLTVEGDRLRALVEWTPFGLQAIRERGFRYLSAEYHENFTDNEQGKVHGPVLLGAGLVVRPCIKRLDPVQLSEAAPDVPTLLHPTLQTELTQEIKMKFAELIRALKEKLLSFKLAESVVDTLVTTATKALEPFTDEAAARVLLASFETSGKTLSEQIGSAPVKLDINLPAAFAKTLSEDDVRKLMHDEAKRLHEQKVALEGKREANLKTLSDTIGAVKGFDEPMRKQLHDAVADLITADMTADQVKKLADAQIVMGNQLTAARKLSSMGFQWPQGTVHISVDSSNEVLALQEQADRRLGLAGMAESRRFDRTGGVLQAANKELAERVLAEFDAANGHRLHAEHKLLAAGDSLVSDVAVPATFERTVIREALYNLVGLQFVDAGTAAFSATTQIPYSYRDTTAAGLANVRKYEGQSIPRAAVKQAMDTAYIIPQKLAFEVSDELRYLTSNGQLVNWDVVAENAANAYRIVGEDLETLIFNEQVNASDQFGAVGVTGGAVATANGTNTIFVLPNFPVVRPKKIYDLQGNQVGSTLYGVVVKHGGTPVTEYDFTNTQGAGTYWWMDYNLGEIHYVNQLGVPAAPANTTVITCDYTYATNVYAFSTDLGALATGPFWDTFLYRYGLRKSLIEDQRSYSANFGLMSGTVMTMIEQADSFVESRARTGTELAANGNLGRIKDVANFKAFAPGLIMGDQRIVIGERGQTRLRIAKPWALGQLQDQRDSQGRFTGKKEAYGDQFIFLHTPTPRKNALTSIVLYSASARVNRVS